MQKADPELSVLPPSRGIPGEGAFLRDFPAYICYSVARNSQEVADMSSKDRRYAEARKVYQEALKSLDEGMKAALRVKLLFTVQTGKWLAGAGIKLWNEIISKSN